MSQIFLGQLSPGEITIREHESQYQKDWGGGVTLAERLGFVMQFKPGDVVMLIDAYNSASAVRAEVEGAMEWGAYQVKVLEGPRSGESLVINWAAVTPVGPGFTEALAPKHKDGWSMADSLRANRRPPLVEAKVDVVPIRMQPGDLAARNEERRAAGLPEFKVTEGMGCTCTKGGPKCAYCKGKEK